VEDFESMVEDSLAALEGWDEALSEWLNKSLLWFENWKEEIIGEDGVLASVYEGIVGIFDSISEIEFSWPAISNPFADVDWCGYVPGWMKDVLGICGGVIPEGCGYTCIASTGDPTICETNCTVLATDLEIPVIKDPAIVDPGEVDCTACLLCLECTIGCISDVGGPCTASTGSGGVPVQGDSDFIGPPCTNTCISSTGGGTCTASTGAGGVPVDGDTDFIGPPCTNTCISSTGGGGGDGDTGGGTTPSPAPCGTSSGCGAGCTSKGCVSDTYAAGGYVDKDGGTVHKGEWVIPTQGGPVLTGGRDLTLNQTYNIDKIVGVDDFERRMEAHDRDLLRQLRTLM